MPSSPSPAVNAARAAFAARLKQVRLDAGLTGRDLATLAGWHSSKVSKIEHGAQTPTAEDVRDWCTGAGAVDQVPDLLASLHAVEGMYVEWRRVERTGLRQHQESYLALYERARQIRTYEAGVIPGILQTPAYATARLTRIAEFSGLPDDVEKAVHARMERQQALQTCRTAVVIEEAALRSRIGATEMMVGQLGHLISVASLPNVSLGIIPPDIERMMWSSPGFIIFDDSRVLVETPTAELTITQPSEISVYSRTFAELSSMAVVGADARTLIMAAIERLG